MEYHNVYIAQIGARADDKHRRYEHTKEPNNCSELGLFVETEADGFGYLHQLRYSPREHALNPGVSHLYPYKREVPQDEKVIQARTKCGVTPKLFYPHEWDALLEEPPTCFQWGASYWKVGTLGGKEPPSQCETKDYDPVTFQRGYDDAVKSLAAAGLLMEKGEEPRKARPLRTKEEMFKGWQEWSWKVSRHEIEADPVLNSHDVPWHWQPGCDEGWRRDEDWPLQIKSTDSRLCVISPKLMKRVLNEVLRFATYLNKMQAKVQFDRGDIQINRGDETTQIQTRPRDSIHDRGKELSLNHGIRVVIRIFRDWYYARLVWSELYPGAQTSPTLVAPGIMEAMEMLSSAPRIEEVWDLIDRIDPTEELSRDVDLGSVPKWQGTPSRS